MSDSGQRWTFVRRRLDDALRLADGPYERCSAELDAIASDIEKRLRTGAYIACAECGSYTCEGTHMVRETGILTPPGSE